MIDSRCGHPGNDNPVEGFRAFPVRREPSPRGRNNTRRDRCYRYVSSRVYIPNRLQVSMSRNREDEFFNPGLDRRGFFSYVGWVLVGLASAGMGWITCRFLAGSRAQPELEPSVFGPPGDYPAGMVTKKDRVVLFRDERGFWAVSVVCPHLGCMPAFLQDKSIFVCPCHGSRFDNEGRLLAGPATHDLPLAALRLDSQGALTAYPKEKVLPGYRFVHEAG